MLDARGYPGRLLWGQEAMGDSRLDLDRAVKGVFDLVQIVGVPRRDQLIALVEEASGGWSASGAHVHQTGLGRYCANL